jgi:large-conductance mechanosensitive channel
MEDRRYRFDTFNTTERPRSPFNFGGIVIGIVVLILIFVVARFVFRLLYLIAPVLLVATAIIDYRVLLGYGKWLASMLQRNTLLGIGAIVLTFIGFPIVALALFGKAMLNRQIRKMQRERQQEQVRPSIGEYVDYEEMEKPIRLPEIEKREEPRRPKPDNQYDQLF